LCCTLNDNTVFKFVNTDTNADADTNADSANNDTADKMNGEKLAGATGKTIATSLGQNRPLVNDSNNYLPDFGGYKKEVRECINIATRGLGLVEDANARLLRPDIPTSSWSPPGATATSTSSSKREGASASASAPVLPSRASSSDSILLPQFMRDIFRPPKGLLIYGPPGVGKSHLMRSLAREMGCPAIEVTHALLLNRYLRPHSLPVESSNFCLFSFVLDEHFFCVSVKSLDSAWPFSAYSCIMVLLLVTPKPT
jgi:hypothetical protein